LTWEGVHACVIPVLFVPDFVFRPHAISCSAVGLLRVTMPVTRARPVAHVARLPCYALYAGCKYARNMQDANTRETLILVEK